MKPYRLKRYYLPKYKPGKDDVDTRSDTTRQGYHEGNIPWGAGNDAAGQGPLWLLENVGAGMGNPNLITGHAPAVGTRSDITNRIVAGTRKYAGRVNTKKLSQAYKEIEARYGDTYNPDELEIWQKNAMPLIRRDAIKKHKGEYVLEDGNDFVLMKNRKSIADARAYSEGRFQAMLPFAIGGGLWAAEDKYRDGKDINLGPKRNVSIQEARDGAKRLGYEKPMSGTDPILKWLIPQRALGKAILIGRDAINNSLRKLAQSDYRHVRQTYDRNTSRFIATPDNPAFDILNWETRILNFGL